MGVAMTAAPIGPAPTLDLGIRIDLPKPKMPKRLSSDECVRLFGEREAVLMNFIPQMLTALAMEQAEAFIEYCRDHRIGEFKRHSREMRKCIDEYRRDLRDSYGRAWLSYQHYLERLKDTVAGDLFKCWCTFTNEASRQYIGYTHKEIPARIALARMILTFVEDYDKNVDKVIAKRLDAPAHRKQDPYVFLVSVLCLDIAEVTGRKMEITDNMALCVKILANKCHGVVDAIIADEKAAEDAAP